MSLVQEGRSQKTTVTTILPVKLSFWYFQCLSSSCLCRCLCLWFCLCQLRLYWGVLCCCCLEAFGAPAVLSLSLSVSLSLSLCLPSILSLSAKCLLLHGSLWLVHLLQKLSFIPPLKFSPIQLSDDFSWFLFSTTSKLPSDHLLRAFLGRTSQCSNWNRLPKLITLTNVQRWINISLEALSFHVSWTALYLLL